MLNKWIGMGRLTRTPDLRNTQDNIDVDTFSIACERDYKGTNGERGVDFIDVVAWRQLANFAAKYLEKGRMVVVEGRWQMRDYKDREGHIRRAWEVQADHIYFADSRRTGERPPEESAEPGGFTELDDDGELPF